MKYGASDFLTKMVLNSNVSSEKQAVSAHRRRISISRCHELPDDYKLSNFRMTRAFLNKFKSHFGRSFREQIAAPHDWNLAWYNVGPNL